MGEVTHEILPLDVHEGLLVGGVFLVGKLDVGLELCSFVSTTTRTLSQYHDLLRLLYLMVLLLLVLDLLTSYDLIELFFVVGEREAFDVLVFVQIFQLHKRRRLNIEQSGPCDNLQYLLHVVTL